MQVQEYNPSGLLDGLVEPAPASPSTSPKANRRDLPAASGSEKPVAARRTDKEDKNPPPRRAAIHSDHSERDI
jgi:hypothetical protein